MKMRNLARTFRVSPSDRGISGKTRRGMESAQNGAEGRSDILLRGIQGQALAPNRLTLAAWGDTSLRKARRAKASTATGAAEPNFIVPT